MSKTPENQFKVKDFFPKSSLLGTLKLFAPLIFIVGFMIAIDKAQTTRQKLVILAVVFVVFAVYALYTNFKKAAGLIKQMYRDEIENSK